MFLSILSSNSFLALKAMYVLLWLHSGFCFVLISDNTVLKQTYKKLNLREKGLWAQRKLLLKWTLFLYVVLPPCGGMQAVQRNELHLTPLSSGSFLFIRHDINLMIILTACQLMCEKKHLKAGSIYSSWAKVFTGLVTHTLPVFLTPVTTNQTILGKGLLFV